jgi:tetratricopeptide (TPR) repeat protein
MKMPFSHKRYLPFILIGLAIAFFLFSIIDQRTLAKRPKTPDSIVAGRYNQDILNGINLLYDRKFKESEKIFRKVISENPDKPVGYFYLAMVSWSRLASGFWSPSSVKEYKKRIEKTIEISKARIDDGKAISDDYFYLGGALGFNGRFELMRENWLNSFFLAREAIDALETSYEKNPNNKDVLLGIGTFDYYTARLSGILKFLSYLLVHKGDTAEGLRKLKEAAEKAVYSGTEAKSTLLHIYVFIEEDFVKAKKIAEELVRKYEHNPRFKVLLGVCQLRLGLEKEFVETLRNLRKRSTLSNYSPKALMWEKRALYLEATRFLYEKKYVEARLKLVKILKNPDGKNDPLMIAWPLVKIGMSYQLEKAHERAERYYNRVINMKNGAGAQFLAKRLLNNPPKKDDPFIGY